MPGANDSFLTTASLVESRYNRFKAITQLSVSRENEIKYINNFRDQVKLVRKNSAFGLIYLGRILIKDRITRNAES